MRLTVKREAIAWLNSVTVDPQDDELPVWLHLAFPGEDESIELCLTGREVTELVQTGRRTRHGAVVMAVFDGAPKPGRAKAK